MTHIFTNPEDNLIHISVNVTITAEGHKYPVEKQIAISPGHPGSRPGDIIKRDLLGIAGAVARIIDQVVELLKLGQSMC